jgi:hypothetical protein
MQGELSMLKKLSIAALLTGMSFVLLAIPVPKSAQSVEESFSRRSDIGVINANVMALKGSDPGPIGTLVDSVLSFHGVTTQVLSGAHELRDQIVNAESGYHSGARHGVSETDVARLINNLAVHFKTPDYTRTSALEVRQLRVQMLVLHPGLIGIAPAFKRNKITDRSLRDEMSPVEAIHVAATMIFQKLNNPEWQLTRSERKVRWQERHKASYKPNFSDQTRRQEVLKAIQGSASQMSARDALTLANESFSIMGIGGSIQ